MNTGLTPVISEKSLREAHQGRYTFVVDRYATKVDVKNSVEKLFNVKVTKVLTNIVKGSKTKQTRSGKRNIDTTYKKARVELKKGQKIDIFEEKEK